MWHCLLQSVSNGISSFLTQSGNSAKTGASSASNTNGQANSFQQQGLPTVAVPTTFTHEAYSGDGASGDAAGSGIAGRKLKQVPVQATASHLHTLRVVSGWRLCLPMVLAGPTLATPLAGVAPSQLSLHGACAIRPQQPLG